MSSQPLFQPQMIKTAFGRLNTPARFFGAYAATLAGIALLMFLLGLLTGPALNTGVTAVFALLATEVLLTAAFAGVALAGPAYWFRNRSR